MSGPLGSSQWMYSSGFYPYEIDQSLRFNDDDSAYLSRTPASAGNRKTWTWSGWVKRGNLGVTSWLFAAATSTSEYSILRFNSTDTLEFVRIVGAVVDAQKITSAVFRDPSAWYHVVLQEDAANTSVRIYVNGVEQAYGTNNEPSNVDGAINNTGSHIISGPLSGIGSEYVDGYMAEVNFIDGTALDPTSFGEFKSGVWIPKKYTGSYGTNGFYLSFADSAAIGDDLSGNANDWTPSGLASTDVLLDSPTNNYCTMNSVDNVITLSDGNLRALGVSGSAFNSRGTFWFNIADAEGWYWEFTSVGGSVSEGSVGVAPSTYLITNTVSATLTSQTKVYSPSGNKNYSVAYGSSWATNDVIGVAVKNGKIWYAKNGVWQASGDPETEANPADTGLTGFYAPFMYSSTSGVGGVFNFGQSPFTYTPPTDFLPLNTASLPEPTITPARDDVPADYFDVVLDTGANIKTASEALFTNQLAAIKDRANVNNWQWIDSPRGLTAVLQSNTTAAETTYVAPSGNSAAFVWRASDSAPVANTDGTISSTVSANQKAGFSIVSYTGTGSAGTVGHGLLAAPKLIMVKNRDQADAWQVYHGANTAAPETDYLVLNTTAATVDAADRWNDTAPTASVFSLGTGVEVNTSTEDYIAYCFAEVEGYSKFGSYTGNGSADGPFCWNGFKPALIMVKRTDTTSNWTILDDAREGYNVDNDPLYPNLSNAEGTTDLADLLSNGFKLRTTDASVNASGGTYIFAAFASMPFKFSGGR